MVVVFLVLFFCGFFFPLLFSLALFNIKCLNIKHFCTVYASKCQSIEELHPVIVSLTSKMLLALGKVHKKLQIKLSLCFTVLHPDIFPVQTNLYLVVYLEVCNFTLNL